MIICLLKVHKSVQTESVTAVHLAEGQFFGWTNTKQGSLGARRLIMSAEDGQDLEPKIILLTTKKSVFSHVKCVK